MTQDVAVIILNWNGSKLLREFLPAAIANTNPEIARVIVADNGSTDDSLQLLRTEFPQVEVMELGENYGFAEGYNRAVRQAGSKYAVLLNSDAAPAPGWIEPLHSHMEANPLTAACQPKILSYRHKNMFEYAGASGGFIDRNGYPYCRGRIFGCCEEDHGQYDETMPVFWATGAAMMVRTDAYLEAGGLDAEFFAHMEEIDLCWRLQLMGYRIMAVPQSVVYHLGGGSLPAKNPKKTYLNFRNSLLMMHKNLPAGVRGRMLIKRRLLDTLAWAKFVLTLDFANARAVVQAHRDYAKMRSRYDTQPQADLLSSGRPNILVQHYLLRRKKWSDVR